MTQVVNNVRPNIEDYQHEPLRNNRSIRILKLLPPNRLETSLRCRLQEVSLDDFPQYEALSYAWGPLDRVCEVRCGSKTLRITKNCYEALHRLRDPENPRLLWIDAICIDQDSQQERNHQVGMMDEVYSKASRVVVWLGDGNNETDRAIRYIQTIVFKKSLNILTSDLMFKSSYSELKNRNTTLISQLDALFSKPWFGRVWPVQEIALSKDCIMVCGRSSIYLKDLMAFLTETEDLTFTLDNISRLNLHRKMWRCVQIMRKNAGHKRQRYMHCTRMLLRARVQNCSEPRDKIIAFHGVLRFLRVQLPMPDYSKSVAQIYREAAAAAIKNDNSLFILSALTGTTEIEGCPSWVPDWSDGQPISPVATWEEEYTGESDEIFYQISDNSKLLTLRGQVVDVVHEISLPFPNIHQIKDEAPQASEIRVLQEWLRKFKRRNKDSPTIMLLKKFVNTLVTFVGKAPSCPLTSLFGAFTGHIYKRIYGDVVEIRSIRIWVNAIQQAPSYTSESILHTGIGKMDKALQGFYHILRKLLDRKAMFRTQQNRLGIASRAAQAGDRVAVFSGCNLPMIIRPEGSNWRLIAPAYVHKIMKGEAKSEKSPVLDFTFV